MMGASLPVLAHHHNGGCVTATADTVKMTEYTDGDFLVRKYVIRRACDAGFDLHYRINLSEVNADYDNNAKELDALWNFISKVRKEEDVDLKSVRVVGYASPDGVHASNEKLASRRAAELKDYLESKSCDPQACRVTESGVASDWKSCCEMVCHSSIPDKEKVMQILSSDCSEREKECALKRLPAAWSYMKTHILPAQRRAEIEITFTRNSESVQRTRISKPTPQVEPQPAPAEVEEAEVVVVQELTKKEQRELRRQAKREAREARREARDARRLAKDAERMVKDVQ